MFTSEHFIWIAICAVFITVLSIVCVKKHFSFKTASLIMAGISLASELSKVFTHMEFANGADITGGMTIEPSALPLHLCSIMIFAFFYLPFCKNEKVKDFLTALTVPISFIGGTLAILMATSGTDFTKPFAYQCFIYHSGMIWFSIYLIATKQVDLGFKAWIRNMIVLAVLAIAMIWVNGALSVYDTNFFFIVRPPLDNLPVLNLDNGWFAYFFTLVGLGVTLMSAVHLPFVIKEKRRKKEEIIKF